MVRNAENPVKIRAKRRAQEIGKTLGQVFREAGVNKAYLSDVPKTGWRDNNLRAIARSLEWSVDMLLHGGHEEHASIHTQDQLMGMAAEAAVRLLMVQNGGKKLDPLIIGQLTVQLFHTLQGFLAARLELPSDSALLVIARQLLAAMRSASNND
jgi:hypothetical protein